MPTGSGNHTIGGEPTRRPTITHTLLYHIGDLGGAGGGTGSTGDTGIGGVQASHTIHS